MNPVRRKSMKKTNLMMLALGVMAVGAVQAHDEIAAKKDASCSNLSPEEQVFASKLSEAKRKLFCLMSADQRKAAITASIDPAISADGAVDKIMKDQHLSFYVEEAQADQA